MGKKKQEFAAKSNAGLSKKGGKAPTSAPAKVVEKNVTPGYNSISSKRQKYYIGQMSAKAAEIMSKNPGVPQVEAENLAWQELAAESQNWGKGSSRPMSEQRIMERGWIKSRAAQSSKGVFSARDRARKDVANRSLWDIDAELEVGDWTFWRDRFNYRDSIQTQLARARTPREARSIGEQALAHVRSMRANQDAEEERIAASEHARQQGTLVDLRTRELQSREAQRKRESREAYTIAATISREVKDRYGSAPTPLVVMSMMRTGGMSIEEVREHYKLPTGKLTPQDKALQTERGRIRAKQEQISHDMELSSEPRQRAARDYRHRQFILMHEAIKNYEDSIVQAQQDEDMARVTMLVKNRDSILKNEERKALDQAAKEAAAEAGLPNVTPAMLDATWGWMLSQQGE